MANLEEKLLSYGDISLKVVRVSDGSIKGTVYGNILVTIRDYREGEQEMIQVKVSTLSASTAVAIATSDKLSLNKFEAYINHKDKIITLGPKDGVCFEEALQNKGIAGYAFNEFLQRLKKIAPNYHIAPFEMTMPEGTTNSHREKLSAFFDKYNINFHFIDTDQRVGILNAGAPLGLVNHYNANKISEIDAEKYLYQLMTDRYKSDGEIKNLKHEVERLGDESFAGIPKGQLVKYTLVACGLALLLIFLLIV